MYEFTNKWRDTLQAWRTFGGWTYLDVTLHAHIGGRPEGLAAMALILNDIAESADLVAMTRSELVDLIENRRES
jgi:hypothetical protein